MRWIRRIFAVLGLLLLAVVAGAAWYVQQTLPRTDGALPLPGLSAAVQVRRDASDVTHILATTPVDAWKALGYVHAQERGWQLAFNRLVMRGELSSVLGPATLETDKLMRTLGIRTAAERQHAALPADAKAALQAYSDGVNAFFAHTAQARTPEFLLLGVNPREAAAAGTWWDPLDSVGWSIMMALDLGGNWGNEFARLSTLGVLDTPALWELFPPYPGEPPAASADLARLYRERGVYRRNGVTTSHAPALDDLRSRIAMDLRAWTDTFGFHEGKGSNNWVVGGARSATGAPLLANDPHLGLSAPAIWYFVRLQAPDAGGLKGMDVVGEAADGNEVMQRVRELDFDVLMLDLQHGLGEHLHLHLAHETAALDSDPAQVRLPEDRQSWSLAGLVWQDERLRAEAALTLLDGIDTEAGARGDLLWTHEPLQFELGGGLRQPATESATLRVGGWRDYVLVGGSWQLAPRHNLQLRAEHAWYGAQGGGELGESDTLTLGWRYQLNADLSLSARVVQLQSSSTTGTLPAQLMPVLPVGAAASPALFVPSEYLLGGVGLAWGEAAEYGYQRRWRGFGSVGVTYDDIVDVGYEARLGVLGPVLGRDRLRVYASGSDGAQAAAEPNLILNLDYLFFY